VLGFSRCASSFFLNCWSNSSFVLAMIRLDIWL
jgi:hypothetical protein